MLAHHANSHSNAHFAPNVTLGIYTEKNNLEEQRSERSALSINYCEGEKGKRSSYKNPSGQCVGKNVMFDGAYALMSFVISSH